MRNPVYVFNAARPADPLSFVKYNGDVSSPHWNARPAYFNRSCSAFQSARVALRQACSIRE